LEDFAPAISAADEILKVSPECKNAVLCKARSLARIDQRAEAIETLDTFLQNHPKDRDALLAKGSNLARLGKNEDALSIFEQIVQDHPDDGLAWYNLATSQRSSIMRCALQTSKYRKRHASLGRKIACEFLTWSITSKD
jgi:tetratricopeptide (TPR) repeat protein